MKPQSGLWQTKFRGNPAAKKVIPKNVAEFIENQKPNGGTPLREALEYAYTEIVENENVDTPFTWQAFRWNQ